MKFDEKLRHAITEVNSCLMVGLDPMVTALPEVIRRQVNSPAESVRLFCREVITRTAQHCCGYKLNLGFFEALGKDGLSVFEDVCRMVPENKIVLADAKRGDIGSTAGQYAEAYFRVFGCDAITLNPLMGLDTLRPFLDQEEKAVFGLVLTSNPGSEDFLMRKLENGNTLSDEIAVRLAKLQTEPDCRSRIGMVIGATRGSDIARTARLFPEAPLLIPGIGAQGATPAMLIETLRDCPNPAIPVISRGIIRNFSPNNPKWIDEVEQAAVRYSRELASLV